MTNAIRASLFVWLLAGVLALPALAQPGRQPPPLPPEDSPPLLRTVQVAFPTQGNVSGIDPQTYLYYMEVPNHRSLPSQEKWVPYTEETEQIIRGDFQRLWDTGFL
ncbi:MAG: hypothetical protein F4Y57_12305, partial [Acidobacteria bacterium]|nr:hypothetical protein [Acidobacteriota bacterium]